MIPRTFPSIIEAFQTKMVVYVLPSITGLTAWIDYIPVKGVVTESATLANTYANGGYQVVKSLDSLTGLQAWIGYIPVYEDASYNKPWSTDAGGYVPVGGLFSIPSLFASGAPGVWYDPSDLTTLFQDSAGTTPVTAVEQPVGLMLDKSQGLVLGTDVAVNGDFATDTGWTKTTGWTISGGSANFSGSNDKQLTQTTLVSGKNYFYTVTATNVSGGKFCVWDSGPAAFKFFEGWTGTQTFTGIIRSGTNTLAIYASAGSFSIDNISVKELPGNHAFQATSASRPVLSARYNLLTKTEQFDDAVWVKNSATVAANGSAWRITDATVVVSANIQQSVTVIANTPHTIRLEFEKQSSGIFALAIGSFFCYVNHATLATFNETMYAGVNPSSSVALVSGTRYRLTCTVTLPPNSNNVRIYAALTFIGGDVNNSFNVAATGFLDVYHADLRVSNDGITQPAYQRVNTSTDYNTTGFLPYLKFDGVDDSLSTNSISFTSTDKMSVFAGVRKLSDVGANILVELSVAADLNNGSFNVIASNTGDSGKRFQFVSKGSLAFTDAFTTSTAYNAPISLVSTGLGDISGDRATLRLNGAQVGQSTADQGTGNYGNYPLYIGRRGGTSFPFNGQLYSMVIVGKAVTAGELSSTETYVNQKTGAY